MLEIIDTDQNAEMKQRLDEGDEFYVKNALKDYVEHKGKPDEQAFYDRYLERVRRYNELNSVDGKIPPAPYTAPYNATGPTKSAPTQTQPRGGIVTDPSQIPGIENAPVHHAMASGNNRETSDQYGGMATNNPDYKTTQKESYIKSDGSFDYESQKAQLDKLGGIVGAYDKDWYAKYKAYRATKGPIAHELGITRQNLIDWLTANYTDIINGSTGKMEDMPTIIHSQGGDRTIYAPTIKMPSLQVKKTSRSTSQKKTEAAKRVVNVDMLDYSAYTGRSEYISRALLGRKAALMYMSRKSTETAGMPVTDISRR